VKIPGAGGVPVARPNVINMYVFTSTPNYLTIRFECEVLSEHPFFAYVSRIDNDYFVLHRDVYYDDLNFNTNPPIIKTKTSDNRFVEIIEPYLIKTNMATYDTTLMNESQKIRYKNLEKFLGNIADTDNPIIGLYTLKITDSL
jgi:hypothetical protein